MDFENENVPQQEETLTTQQPAETPAEPFRLNDVPEEQPKKKKKTGLIIGIIAAVAAIALVIAGVLALGGMKPPAETAATPQEALLAAQKEALYGAADSVANFMAQAHAYAETSPVLVATGGSKADMHLLLSQGILDRIDTILKQYELPLDAGILKDIAISLEMNTQGDLLQYLVGLGLGENEIAQLDVIMDYANTAFYIGLPELNDYYLKMDVEGTAAPASVGSILEQMPEAATKLWKDLPDAESTRTSLRGYADLLLALQQEFVVGEETVTLGDVSQVCTTVTCKITEAQMIEFAKTLLEKAKNDEALKQLLCAYGDYFTQVARMAGTEGEIPNAYDEFVKTLEEGIKELEGTTAQEGNYLELTGYLDAENRLRGHQLNFFTDGEEGDGTLRLVTLDSGDKQLLEFQLLDHSSEDPMLTVLGEQSKQDGVYNGMFELKFPERRSLTLELKDLSLDENLINGTIQLTPNTNLLKDFLGDGYVTARLLGDELGLRIDVKVDGKAQESFIGYHFTSEGESIIGFTVEGVPVDPQSITLPAEDKVMIGEEAAEQWGASIDAEALLERLEKAGISLEELLGSLMAAA